VLLGGDRKVVIIYDGRIRVVLETDETLIEIIEPRRFRVEGAVD
jgi:hypothetical protein